MPKVAQATQQDYRGLTLKEVQMKKTEYMLWLVLMLVCFVSASLVATAHAEEPAIIWGSPELELKYGATISLDDSAFTAGLDGETKQEPVQHEYSSISISDTEMQELRQIVAAESQTQSIEGRKAVVEVIFNRVLDPRFPNTVHGVLSQKGQFATWRMRNAAWVQPSYADEAIQYVIANGRTVLPSTAYIYFDTRGVNGRQHIRIGAHYFGR